MNSKNNYTINLDTKFGYSQLIDIPDMVAACKEKWFNQTLCQVNESVVRLGILQVNFIGTSMMKKMNSSLFLQGKLLIDAESETICLGPQQGYSVRRASGIAPGHQKKLWFS